MSIDEELSDQAKEAKNPFDKKVAASMAVIAAVLAVVSVTAQHYAAEELLTQAKSSDQWSYYQAKSIRRYSSDIARDEFKAMSGEEAAKESEIYAKNAERYEKESKEIQDEAKKLGAESEMRGEQAVRLHIAEIFLEIGIVFATLAILTKRELVWWASLGSAAVGAAIAMTTRFITQ